ncbi:hypothetical protein BJY01DRAFT_221144 [Aspergillus pseudoustus]|uniref:Azaphilone pigments biosynthesis cluster protein L N-terminal domain-containing protein n=1 Tax=Aspergillus pseudoustus TaxID=1810923 RepID=A0ABR4JE99_9EURO
MGNEVLDQQLFAFASNAISVLSSTTQNIQPHTKSVTSLLIQLEAIVKVIYELEEAVQTKTDIDLSALRLPISYCGTVCEQFNDQVQHQLAHFNNDSERLRGWVRLRYMGGGVDDTKELLSVCDLTLSISLANMHLRLKSLVTIEDFNAHVDSIKAAEFDIKTQIEALEVKFESMPDETTAQPEKDSSERQQLTEQRRYLLHCLQICVQLFEHVEEIEVQRKVRPGSTYSRGHPGSNISTISNYSRGDSVQFMVSADRTIIDGSNRALGPRVRQVGGHLDNTSIQKLSSDFASTDAKHNDNEASRTHRDDSSPANSSDPRSVFKSLDRRNFTALPSQLALEASATPNTSDASMYIAH